MDNLLANNRAVPYLASELEEHLYLFTAWAEYGPLPWFCFQGAKDYSVPSPPQCVFFSGFGFSAAGQEYFRVKRWPQELLRDQISRLKIPYLWRWLWRYVSEAWALLRISKTNVKFVQNSLLYMRQDAVIWAYLSRRPIYVFPGKKLIVLQEEYSTIMT